MNSVTRAVIRYKENKNDDTFSAIWQHYESKINTIVHKKTDEYNGYIDSDLIQDAVIDALLGGITSYCPTKNVEFNTHFVYQLRSKINCLYRHSNMQKRKIIYYSKSLDTQCTTHEHNDSYYMHYSQNMFAEGKISILNQLIEEEEANYALLKNKYHKVKNNWTM